MTGGRADTTNPDTIGSLRELDSRTGGGLHVRLLWSRDDDQLWVAVADARTRESFRIAIRAGERPMDVFRHPYAYAPFRACARRTLTPTEAEPAVRSIAGGFAR